MGDRFTLSLRAYTWVAYAALATLVLIVLSGAGVRLTGSGLGCPSWPDCRGTFLPELSSHVWIEYGNRLFSSVVGIACIAAGVLAVPRPAVPARPGAAGARAGRRRRRAGRCSAGSQSRSTSRGRSSSRTTCCR